MVSCIRISVEASQSVGTLDMSLGGTYSNFVSTLGSPGQGLLSGSSDANDRIIFS